MRYLILVLTFLFVSLAFAKSDVDFHKFNDAMNDNIDHVIKHNPQIYEQKKTRAPASVDIEKEKSEEQYEDTEDKINTFDQQNIGLEDW